MKFNLDKNIFDDIYLHIQISYYHYQFVFDRNNELKLWRNVKCLWDGNTKCGCQMHFLKRWDDAID